MTTTKVGIELEVRLNKADEQIRKLTSEVTKLKGAAEGAGKASGEGLGKAFGGMIGKAEMAAAAVLGVAHAYDRISDRSLKFQAIQSQVTVGINKARDATMGLVSDYDLMRASNEAVRDGLVKSEEEFAKMAGLATKLGLTVGKDATESIDLFSNALDKLSPKALDALGLAVDQDQAFFKYAITLGKTADQLTEAEQKQALMNAAMEDGEAKLRGLNLQVDEGALTFQQFKTAIINTADEGFVYFTGKISETSDALADLLIQFQDWNAYDQADSLGISDANMNASYRRVSKRGMAGLQGQKGAEAGLRNKAAQETLDTQIKMNSEMQLSISMLEANATAHGKVTDALDKYNKAHRKKIDKFKEERALFRSQMGEVEMGRAGASLGSAIDRDKFNAQLGGAQMADAGTKAKQAQLKFEEETAEKRKKILEDHNRALEESLEAEIRAEQRKREAIEETMRSRMEIASATQALTSQSVQLASFAGDAAIKGGKRREAAQKALAGTELITIGIVETVKAVAAFAGFNYVEGALHVGAAALAYARGGQLLAQAGKGGGGGGGMGSGFAGGAAFGGGTDTGGSPQSSTGGGSRPTSNGPVSEESVQRSGRGGRPGPAHSRNSDGPAPVVQLVHFGQLDDQSLVKIDQGLTRIRRKSGRNSS